MRWTLLAAVLALAGCLSAAPPGGDGADDCAGAPVPYTFWFGPDHALVPVSVQEAGTTPGNGFREAFMTDDMDEWLSEPADAGLLIEGNVTIEFWARNVGTPAPFAIGGEPGEGYHFFNQFGSDRTFQPAYAIEYADAVPMAGSVDHYTETLEMPAGGFVVEAGDRIRLLLTSLVLDDEDGSGHDILWGGDTLSQIRFTATCYTARTWTLLGEEATPITIQANRGLLTGAVPAQEGVNQQTVPFALLPETDRLTIRLEQEAGSPNKDDMDLAVLDAAGEEVWSIGSPYADESGTYWRANLDALMPPGEYRVRVDSYSGNAYEGTLTVVQEQAKALHGGTT